MRLYDKRKKLRSILSKLETARSAKRSPAMLAEIDSAIARIGKKLRKVEAAVDPCSDPSTSSADPTSPPPSSSSSSDLAFSSLALSAKTLAGLEAMNVSQMTEIQSRAIPRLLNLFDVMASAKTGSGKTLAFLVPALELMFKLKFKPFMGTGCIVISPTRELSAQTFGVLRALAAHHNFRCALAIGGTERAAEAKELAKGATLVVATPGRLLDHLRTAAHFVTKNLKCLVIDEADRILDAGFALEMDEILRLLPRRRQTMFFSATLNEETRGLAEKAVRKKYVSVGLEEVTTPNALRQTHVLCPPDRRLDLLCNLIQSAPHRKRIVFMSACLQVEFLHRLLNYVGPRVLALHGQLTANRRAATLFQFSKARAATLLCTDVLARGMDIPAVHEIVQLDAPVDTKEYIHRVGRTARAGADGDALLILRPAEAGFVRELARWGIRSREVEVRFDRFQCVEARVSKALTAGGMKGMAERAFATYLRAYASHALKQFFDPERLDLLAEARAFGLPYVPAKR